MPVTAKLSKRFYEVLGEDVANELVNWFNEVDATYRADLRELNELNFARFDAKLGERLAELDAKWGTRWSALDSKLEQRLAELRSEMEARFARADAKLEQRIMELRSEMEAGFARADAKLEQRTMELRSEMRTGLAQASTELHEVRADILKWMFGFWAPTALAVVGTGLGVLNLLLRR